MTPRRLAAAIALVSVFAAGCTSAEEPSALDGGAAGPPAPALDESQLEAALEAAGCDVVALPSDAEPTHVDPAGAPSADEMYPERPPTAGPHFGTWLEPGVYDGPIEERAAVHNLEHGAIAVWYDPAAIDPDELEQLEAWAEARNQAGLEDRRSGAGLVVAPFDGPPLDRPIAFRAWEVAGDCRSFDVDVADSFVRRYFGEAGDAPEGFLGGDPSRVLDRTADV